MESDRTVCLLAVWMAQGKKLFVSLEVWDLTDLRRWPEGNKSKRWCTCDGHGFAETGGSGDGLQVLCSALFWDYPEGVKEEVARDWIIWAALAITTSHNIKSAIFGSWSLEPVSCGAIVKSDFSTKFSSTKAELGAL